MFCVQSFRFGPEISFVAAACLELFKKETKKILVGNGIPGMHVMCCNIFIQHVHSNIFIRHAHSNMFIQHAHSNMCGYDSM